jgi:hypothetical protein
VSQVEEQKRRAEADKLAALTALENASAEFMREKEEKKELEAKIAAMQVREIYKAGIMSQHHHGSSQVCLASSKAITYRTSSTCVA